MPGARDVTAWNWTELACSSSTGAWSAGGLGLGFQAGTGDRTGLCRVDPVTPVAAPTAVASHVASCPAVEAVLGSEGVRPDLHRMEVHHGGAGAHDHHDQRQVPLDSHGA